jgi:hypothetical protein
VGIADGAAGAARAACGAAVRGYGEARDAGQAWGLRRRHAQLAQSLGEAVFRQREGEAGLEPEIARIVEEMRAVRGEIAALAVD